VLLVPARLTKPVAALAALLVVVSLLVAVPGRLDVYGPTDGTTPRGVAPAWARPCLTKAPRPDRQILALCAKVHGRVVASSLKHAPGPELHVVVLAGLHLVVVRTETEHAKPGIGSTVTVVGPLLRARNGEREIEAWSLA